VLERQLSRIAGIDSVLAHVPADVSFSLDADEKGVPQRDPGDLLRDIKRVDANYSPECLASCELCYLCRHEASGSTSVLGKSVREELGGIESVPRALKLARGDDPLPVPEDLREAAAILRRAASLRRDALAAARAETW
jgi:hypothetical protein